MEVRAEARIALYEKGFAPPVSNSRRLQQQKKGPYSTEPQRRLVSVPDVDAETDRESVGQRVPAAWRATARPCCAAWSITTCCGARRASTGTDMAMGGQDLPRSIVTRIWKSAQRCRTARSAR